MGLCIVGLYLFLLVIAVLFVLFLPKFDSKILIASSCGGVLI